MRFATYLPLLAVDVAVLSAPIICRPTDTLALGGTLSMVLGFTLTYLVGLRSTKKNAEAVLKLGNGAPFALPISLFVVPTLVSGLALAPKETSAYVFFGSALTAMLASYAAGIAILVRDLRRQARSSEKVARASAPAGKKRVLLVNPVNPERFGLSNNPSSIFPPLGLGIIAALTPKDYAIELIDENIERFEYRDADLVALTSFTASAPRAYEIAAMYRARGVPTVMGGIHASMRPDEALERVDSIVTGEAESIWPRLLEDFSAGALARRYDGGKADMAAIPKVDRSLFSDRYLFGTIQTSRGCPMDCYFCSVSAFNGRSFRQRPVEEVLDELESMSQGMVFFVDDNLIGYGPEDERRALRLFKGMVDRGIKKEWFAQVSLNFGNNPEVQAWAAKSGCRMVFIGLESPDPEELKVMRKGMNLSLEYESALRSIRSRGIAVLGAFIFGSDAETERTIAAKTRFILSQGVDAIQTTILTPLPGTRQYREFEASGRLAFTDYPADWARYDMSELTYRLRSMDEASFALAVGRSQRKLYSLATLVGKFLRTAVATRSLSSAFWAWGSNMTYRSVLKAR